MVVAGVGGLRCSSNQEDGIVVGVGELAFTGEGMYDRELRAPRRRKYIRGRSAGGRRVQRKEADGSGAEGLGALFACPVRVRERLNARAKVGVVIRLPMTGSARHGRSDVDGRGRGSSIFK